MLFFIIGDLFSPLPYEKKILYRNMELQYNSEVPIYFFARAERSPP